MKGGRYKQLSPAEVDVAIREYVLKRTTLAVEPADFHQTATVAFRADDQTPAPPFGYASVTWPEG